MLPRSISIAGSPVSIASMQGPSCVVICVLSIASAMGSDAPTERCDPTTPTRQRRHRHPLLLDTRGQILEKGSAAHDRRKSRLHQAEKMLQPCLVHCDPIDLESSLSRQPTGSHRVGLKDGSVPPTPSSAMCSTDSAVLSWVAMCGR